MPNLLTVLRGSGKPSLLFLFCMFLGACNEAEVSVGLAASGPASEGQRWYSVAQVAAGANTFATNCAQCHGNNAQGTVEDWKQRLDDGSLPPPPLNGSAHAWHHPREVLLQVINTGGAPFGGNMPAFAAVLSESEKLGAIAYFQSFWSDEIYAQWNTMGGIN